MSPLRSIIAITLTLGCLAHAPAALAQANSGAAAPTRSARSARFVEIANLDGFSGFFNLGQGTVRMMAILSPTCEGCAAAFREIRRIMEKTPTRRLRAYVVFVPAREDDPRRRALILASEMNERRASLFWDPNLAVPNAFRSLASDGEPVMDGCFVFDTNAVLGDAPSLATFPHAADAEHRFDGNRFEARVGELLARFEAEQRRRPIVDKE